MLQKRQVIVELFYDVISPYSWVSFEALCRYNKKFSNMQLQLKPVLLGAIFQKLKQKPPTPARKLYTKQDLYRLSKYFNLPYSHPKHLHHVLFEKGGLPAQKLLTATATYHPQHLESLSRELSHRVWSKDLDVTTSKSLREPLSKLRLTTTEINQLLLAAEDPVIKKTLRETTQTALDYGAFGVPTYVVHLEEGPEMLFGSERLMLLCHYLNQPFPGPLNEFQSKLL